MKLSNLNKYADCIGGYGELELPYLNSGIHMQAMPLQSARAGLCLFLKSVKAKKIYIPEYNCNSILPALNSLNIQLVRYEIDSELNPINELNLLKDEYILLINYFGLCSSKIDFFFEKSKIDHSQIIVDNSQALFEPTRNCAAQIFSPRKFLGIPDGGFLYSNVKIDAPTERFYCENTFLHLVIRSSGDEQKGYKYFLDSEKSLNDYQPKLMSLLAERLIKTYDFENLKEKRIANYTKLDKKFNAINHSKLNIVENIVPLCYPLKLNFNISKVSKILLNKKIYLPRYWSDHEKSSVAKEWYENTLFLPIDHRINNSKMDFMINSVIDAIEKIGQEYE